MSRAGYPKAEPVSRGGKLDALGGVSSGPRGYILLALLLQPQNNVPFAGIYSIPFRPEPIE